MKKNDIALLVIIISISALGAYLVTNALMGNPKEQSAKVQTMDPVLTEIVQPDPNVFYDGAINPAVRVDIDGEQSEEASASQETTSEVDG